MGRVVFRAGRSESGFQQGGSAGDAQRCGFPVSCDLPRDWDPPSGPGRRWTDSFEAALRTGRGGRLGADRPGDSTMPQKLPQVSPQAFRQICELDGWTKRRDSGPHETLTKPGFKRPIVIPRGRRPLSRRVLTANMRTAGWTLGAAVRVTRNVTTGKRLKGPRQLSSARFTPRPPFCSAVGGKRAGPPGGRGPSRSGPRPVCTGPR